MGIREDLVLYLFNETFEMRQEIWIRGNGMDGVIGLFFFVVVTYLFFVKLAITLLNKAKGRLWIFLRMMCMVDANIQAALFA